MTGIQMPVLYFISHKKEKNQNEKREISQMEKTVKTKFRSELLDPNSLNQKFEVAARQHLKKLVMHWILFMCIWKEIRTDKIVFSNQKR
jgi:hypothetical protein